MYVQRANAVERRARLTGWNGFDTIGRCASRFCATSLMSRHSPPRPESARLPACEEPMDAVAGASERVSRVFGWPDGSVHLAEVHWYEAAGIGRKEFKIKHLL